MTAPAPNALERLHAYLVGANEYALDRDMRAYYLAKAKGAMNALERELTEARANIELLEALTREDARAKAKK